MMSFLYFAFGSNLLTDRIRINNPSAEKVAVAKLSGYRLCFGMYSERWCGAVASIIPCDDSHVWGVVWRLDEQHRESLDRQEGVHCAEYTPISVTVTSREGNVLQCRSYQLVIPPSLSATGNCTPTSSSGSCDKHSAPSAVYMRVIRSGAVEHALPTEYCRWLDQLRHNGHAGSVDVALDYSALVPLAS